MKTCKWCGNITWLADECLTCLGAQADLEPGEWADYLAYVREVQANGLETVPNPESNPYSLTLQGWGAWSIMPTLNVTMKLMSMAPLIIGGNPDEADMLKRRLT